VDEGEEKPRVGFARSLATLSADPGRESSELKPFVEPWLLQRLAQLRLSERHPPQPS